jgi:hypothetical protein
MQTEMHAKSRKYLRCYKCKQELIFCDVRACGSHRECFLQDYVCGEEDFDEFDDVFGSFDGKIASEKLFS